MSSGTYRKVVIGIVIIPFLSFVLAVVLTWRNGIDLTSLLLFLGMYIITGLGIALGFHRLFTHQSFETSATLNCLLGVCGSMATEGSLFSWVVTHRTHHQHSDKPGDPHSPWGHGYTWKGIMCGFIHAHVGWLILSKHRENRRPEDIPVRLRQNKALAVIDRFFFLWVAIGLLIPAILGGLISQSWKGALLGFLWGGLVRMFILHHVTWSINSACHMIGRRAYQTTDQSRNNWFFALVGFGEGNHNNHHKFPQSARHGITAWWKEPDLSWLVLRILEKCGLVWKVQRPNLASKI